MRSVAGTEGSAFGRLNSALSDLLHPVPDHLREERVRNFLRLYSLLGIPGDDFERIVPHLTEGIGGAYGPGDVFPTAAELYVILSDDEKSRLKDNYFELLAKIAEEFPGLTTEFPAVFGGLSRSG